MEIACSGKQRVPIYISGCFSFHLSQECCGREKLHRISVLRGLVQRDERVNRGEGACTGAFGIKPPQERTTSTACVGSVIRFLSTSGLRLVKTHASLSLPFLRGPQDGCALFMKQTQLRREV